MWINKKYIYNVTYTHIHVDTHAHEHVKAYLVTHQQKVTLAIQIYVFILMCTHIYIYLCIHLFSPKPSLKSALAFTRIKNMFLLVTHVPVECVYTYKPISVFVATHIYGCVYVYMSLTVSIYLSRCLKK